LSPIRTARALLAAALSLVPLACSNNVGRAVNPTVGIDSGVSLTTSGNVTSLLTGQSIVVTASVTNASNGSGVRWSLTGVGSLTSVTSTTVTYVAPASVTGAATALITATSVANPAALASAALIVLGTPQIQALTLFPANASVAYSAPVIVAGGQAPFTWTVLSGALPAGLALSGSASAATFIQGTPTATGTYNFTLQATDSQSRSASVALMLVVKPQAACVLQGRFTYLFTGFRGGGTATDAGVIAIDASGKVSGEHDYKDPTRTTADETFSASTCTNRTTNAGYLTLNATSGTLTFNFAVTPPDGSGVIHAAKLALIASGSDSGSGQLALQDLSGITTTPPAGDFAFGLLGATDPSMHFASAGRFTTDATGTLANGAIDRNGAAPLTDAALTGVLSAADAQGRGTLALSAGGQSTQLAYYRVNAGKYFLVDIDPVSSGTPFIAGQFTAQTGNTGAASFDGNALATPSILSLFGATGGNDPVTVMTLGRLSNANAAAATVDALLDQASHAIDAGGQMLSAQSYSIASNGRGALSLASAAGAQSYAFYLDAVSNGYIVEQNSTAGRGGRLEAQFQGPYPSPPPSGIFPASLPNLFVLGTAYPQARGPISLIAQMFLNFDTLSSNVFNGSFAIDPATGRGVGSISENGVSQQPGALYIISPTKMDLLRFGTLAVDSSIEDIIQD
jgi:hypothetical protein